MAEKTYKIAVIGSGIAGLSASYLLSKRHDVTLLEKSSTLGMGQYGVPIPGLSGDKVVDVPLRIFNRSYYPNLFCLCQELGVDLRFAHHEGAFGKLGKAPYFRYHNLEVGSKNYSYTLPRLRDWPWLLKVGPQILRLKSNMRDFLRSGSGDDMVLAEFFQKYHYSKQFQYEFFLPILSSICTCSYEDLLQYPAGIVVECMYTLMETTPTQRFIGGTRALENALAKSVDHVRYGVQVKGVRPSEGGSVLVDCEGEGALAFDHVIFATQANQAHKMLDASFEEERQLLSQIPYGKSDMVVHRDPSLMPPIRGQWAPVYYGIKEGAPWPMATIWINQVEPGFEGDELLLQTWNPLVDIDESKVLGRTTFERSIVTKDSLQAIRKIEEMHLKSPQDRQLWFCGSFATRAVPLLESGLVSAVRIAERFGVEAPAWFQGQSEVLRRLSNV